MTGAAMTVAELRSLIAQAPDTAPVFVTVIVGGDLGTDQMPLYEVAVTTDRNGYAVVLDPNHEDEYDTRALIDEGLHHREEHDECGYGTLSEVWS